MPIPVARRPSPLYGLFRSFARKAARNPALPSLSAASGQDASASPRRFAPRAEALLVMDEPSAAGCAAAVRVKEMIVILEQPCRGGLAPPIDRRSRNYRFFLEGFAKPAVYSCLKAGRIRFSNFLLLRHGFA